MGHFILLVTCINDHRHNALRGNISNKSHFPFVPHFDFAQCRLNYPRRAFCLNLRLTEIN